MQFALDASTRQLLADFHQPARFVVSLPTYPHESGPLCDEIRQSLLDDLALSDRERAA